MVAAVVIAPGGRWLVAAKRRDWEAPMIVAEVGSQIAFGVGTKGEKKKKVRLRPL